ncbi:MAG: oligosaccharide flippase family protein [Candidatus Eisenbacteria bacterium]|uniref:Oligosaccharide flippase family protein n=1 Tax=Eiseniibacteriota bacterium TaxID=2212470 RepID=A0A933WAJ2_UNCEI|nr:oligosaccharide flippase family protein [Candidatus Eisenbacteria bacterium]
MHPRKFVRDSMNFAFAQYIVRATLMLRGIVAARIIGPDAFGAWSALQMMMEYGTLPLLGTQQGLDQMVPPRIVAGDEAALRRVKRAALFNISMLTALFVLACVGWVTLGSSRLLGAWGPWGIVLALVCIATINLSNYQTSIQRSHGDFSTISGWMLIQGAIGGIAGLALTPWLHGWGLLAGWTAGCVFAFAYSSVRSRDNAPMSPVPAPEGLDLVQIGFPMFVLVASALVMRSLDRLIILRYLGNRDFGFYSISMMALTFLLYMPDAVTYVMYPRLLKQFGEDGGDPAGIREVVQRVLRTSSIFVPVLSGLVFLAAAPVVGLLLPKFLPGIGALRALAFGALGLAFANFASVVLMTVGRQAMLMPTALVSIMLGAALDLGAVKLGYGITGVAWATLVTYAANGAVLLTMALTGLGLRGREVLAGVGRLYLPMGLAIALVWTLERYLPGADASLGGLTLRMLGSMLLFGVTYTLAVWPLAHGIGIRKMVSEFNLPIIGPLLRRFGDGPSSRD